ncbi:Peroxin-3 [Radiomyces spectabilis]|uniref:Peroxin-3 n=1 Tax=Radiomyces spectabilis TaxID=64574 RepID=UPI00221E3E83|nr:Peroxin-3 [Radiomyces spectabilis]KAI8368180.1 Peroxin-3 [Radiomyces spectabilis]
MSLLNSVKDYVKRHRRGLFITATIAGGGYLAGRYATGKIRDLQEKASAERMSRESLKRRFNQNQNDCVFTVLSLLPALGDHILHDMNIEAAWAKLQESRKLEKLEEKRKAQRPTVESEQQGTPAEVQPKGSDNVDTADKPATKDESAPSYAAVASAQADTAEKPATTDESAPSYAAVANTEINTEGASHSEVHPPAKEKNISTEMTEQQQDAKTRDRATATGGELDNSIGSLVSSFHGEDPASLPIPGILDKKAKYLLWEEIKTTSFTRTLTAIYSVTLLTLLTHIQLNLLGRFMYMWSVSVLQNTEPSIRLQPDRDSPQNGFLDPQTERMYLSASWWLIHRGWKRCSEKVKEAVDDIVGSIPLKSTLSYNDADAIISQLRARIEYDQRTHRPINFRSFMLPDNEEEEAELLREAGFTEGDTGVDMTALRRLLDETRDFIDSPDFLSVLTSCLDEVFAIFDRHALAKNLAPIVDPMVANSSRIEEIPADSVLQQPSVKKLTLANLLPSISRQAHLVIAGNEYLNAFAYIKELQAFSAFVYTHYDEEMTAP